MTIRGHESLQPADRIKLEPKAHEKYQAFLSTRIIVANLKLLKPLRIWR